MAFLTLQVDGGFTYQPDPDFTGTDSFSYLANDGSLDSNTVATVTIQVDPTNGTNVPPVANDQRLTVADDSFKTIELEYSDSDGPGAFTSTILQHPENGTLSLIDGIDTFSYIADEGFNGVDSFTFQINDGLADSNIATVQLNVQHFPATSWENQSPALHGLDAAKLQEFADSVGGRGTIIKNGYVVKTWGNQAQKSDWASAGKPMLGTLLFFAIQEGLINDANDLVNDTVAQAVGIPLIQKDLTMTYSDLANMVSGYSRGEDPGQAFAYNDFAIRLYGLILEELFSSSLNAAAQSRLGMLQFQDGSLFSSRQGLGIATSIRDYARLGWFWLNRGNWNGQQVLEESLFDEYMKAQVPVSLPRTTQSGTDYLSIGSYGGPTDQIQYGPGIYGMNWWFNGGIDSQGTLAWPDAPLDTIQANGHFGEEMVVIIPTLNMVVSNIGDWGSFEPGNPSSGINANLKLFVEAHTVNSN